MLKAYHCSIIELREYIIYERFSLINLWNVSESTIILFFSWLSVLQIFAETRICSLMHSQFQCSLTALPQHFQWIIICAKVCTQPVFFSPYFVLQLHTDLDKGDSAVKYTLSGDGAGSIFTIDQTTGDIHALRSLDREEKPYYTLRAQAVDINTNRPLEPESEFVIKVQDINDNEPKFLEGPYTASVPEMSPVGKYPSEVICSAH